MLQPGFGTVGKNERVLVLPGFPSPQLVTAHRITHMESICMAGITLNGFMLVMARLSYFRGKEALMEQLLA